MDQVNFNSSFSKIDQAQSSGLSGAVQERKSGSVECLICTLVAGIILMIAFLPPVFCCSSLSPVAFNVLQGIGRFGVGLSVASAVFLCCKGCTNQC